MADAERKEDLNHRTDDIEERVKQMLDPTIPDDALPSDEKPAKNPGKVIPVLAHPEQDLANNMPLSAPEVPALSKPVVNKKAINVTEATPDAPAFSQSDTQEPETAPEIEINIDDDNKTPDEVAQKLDKAIAGLGAVPEDEPASPGASGDIETGQLSDEMAEPTPRASSLEQAPEAIDDIATDKAVEEIIAQDSDELLEMEDALRDSDDPVAPTKKEHRKFGLSLKALLKNSGFRWGMAVVLVMVLLGMGAVPQARYYALNTARVRASSSLTILDESTQQPLKNVQVKIGETVATTDVNGTVQFTGVKLGPNLLTISKRAFAPVTKTVTLGWGSNPLGAYKLTPTGTQYRFNVTDFLTTKPIGKVEATSAEASALSDDKGNIKLTLVSPGDQKINVTLKSPDYRDQQLSLDPDEKTVQAVKLAPSKKQLFISKRSGKFDIYSIYIDGQDEKLVLAGSGKERDDMVLVPHPSANVAAFVSTRANQTNSEGFLLSNLILINTEDNTTSNIGVSERIQVVDWSGDYLLYVQITAGSSASSPKRYKLMSYNYKDESSKELASSNYFNDVIFANGAVYYAPSSAYQTTPANFYKISLDGTGSQVVFNKEVWNVFRTSYDHFALSVQQEWYDYLVGGSQPTKLSAAPSDQKTRVYVDSPDGKRSAWIDNRDGKGVLLIYDIATKSDKTLHSQAGVTYPVRWLNNKVLVYRVKSGSETADYAISTDGGEPVKIRDVTHSGGVDRWYYY